jgi:hypothetical protein
MDMDTGMHDHGTLRNETIQETAIWQAAQETLGHCLELSSLVTDYR